MPRCDLAANNLGQSGAQIEKKILEARGSLEHPWARVGDKPGTQIWYVDNYRPVLWPPKDTGVFFGGHCYIVLHTTKADLPTTATDGGNSEQPSLQHEVFIWVGDECSDDDYRTAFHLCVEFDEYMDNPVQHREIMNRESRRFQSIFLAMTVFDGRPDAAFDIRKPKDYKPRLLRVQPANKSKRDPVVRQVPLSATSLNEAESFIYDGGLEIIVWHGRSVPSRDKLAAQNVAKVLHDVRSGRPSREFVNQGIDDETEWFKKLGGRQPVAAEPAEETPIPQGVKRLMRVSDSSGELKMTEIAMADLVKFALLDTNDAFVLDDGFNVMVWIGHGASASERKQALNYGIAYLVKYNRPLTTPLSRYLEGGETKEFLAAFPDGGAAVQFRQRGMSHRESKAYRTLKRGDPSFRKLLSKGQSRQSADDIFGHLEQAARTFINNAPDANGIVHEDAPATAPAEANKPQTEGEAVSKTEGADASKNVAAQETNGNQPTGSDAGQDQAKGDSGGSAAASGPGTDTAPAAAESSETPAAEKAEASVVEDTGDDKTEASATKTAWNDSPYYHGEITKEQADEMLLKDGKRKEGRFLFRFFPGEADSAILSVVYKGKGTHHHTQCGEDGKLTLNKKPTNTTNMEELIRFLSTKKPWWPVPLTEGLAKK